MSNNRNTFIVDDDPMQVQMLKDHLSDKLKLNITTFSTGEDCLSNMDKEPVIVVLDYYLNSVEKNAANGIDILKKIKAKAPNTEVIMLSGQEKIEVAVESMNNGAFDYVVKNESAFVNTENKIRNVFKNIKLQENAAMYKKATIFMGIALVLILIIAGILIATGVASDQPNVSI